MVRVQVSPAKVTDRQITSSSSFSFACRPHNARLDLPGARWCPSRHEAHDTGRQSWLQVRFNELEVLTGVATQGNGSFREWTMSYQVSYSMDGERCVHTHGY